MRLHVCFHAKKHRALLTTCELAIAPGGCVLVFYTHHRPHLAQRDMEFFDMARGSGWKCDKVLTERFPVRFSRLFGILVSSWDLIIISSSLFSPCFRRTQARRRCARPCMGGNSHERKMLVVYFLDSIECKVIVRSDKGHRGEDRFTAKTSLPPRRLTSEINPVSTVIVIICFQCAFLDF